MIRSLDDAVGSIISTLEENDLLDIQLFYLRLTTVL